MEREEGRGVDNGLDSRYDVGNGLHRDRVDVGVDDRATRMQNFRFGTSRAVLK